MFEWFAIGYLLGQGSKRQERPAAPAQPGPGKAYASVTIGPNGERRMEWLDKNEPEPEWVRDFNRLNSWGD